MKAETYQGRNHTMNYMKALACVCVLMLHCGFPGIIGKLLYGPSRFAVPFFFMVSGYYAYHDDARKTISRLPGKIKHIATLLFGTEIIYFIWHVIQNAINAGKEGVAEWLFNTFNTSKLIQLLCFQTTPIGDVSWFLVALLLCYFATYFIAKYQLWKLFSGMVPVLLLINIFVGEILPFFGVNSQWYWCSNFWVLGLPFYSMGFWIKRNQKFLCEKCSVKNTVVVVVISLMLITIERIITNASQLFVGNIFIAITLFLFSVKYPSFFKKRSFIETIGEKYAFFVYVLHPIVRDVLYKTVLESVGLSTHVIITWTRPVVVFVICVGIAKAVYGLESKYAGLIKQARDV